MSERSVVTPTRRVNPSTMANAIDKLITEQESLRAHFRNRVLDGIASTPTNASTQASGVGNTDWNVNLSAILVTVDGVSQHFVPQADYDVHSGSLLTGLADTYSVRAALVAKNVAGTVSLAVVKGTAALTAAVVAPTDAEIQSGVAAGNAWVKIAELTINRTGDVTVTQNEDNGKRPIPGVNIDTNFGDYSSIADGS